MADMTPNAAIRMLSVSGLLAGVLAISLLLGGCGKDYHAYRVAGESMLPLLHPGDRIFVDEAGTARSDLHDGDIIVLRRDNAIVLKRIMAIPGETISGANRKVFRNGKQLDEPYLAPATGENLPTLVTFASRTVGAEELFVMGDNRDLSFDSRASEYAPVRFSDVVGQYRWTYWRASSVAK
jgi:signal peptidase I